MSNFTNAALQFPKCVVYNGLPLKTCLRNLLTILYEKAGLFHVSSPGFATGSYSVPCLFCNTCCIK